MKQSENKFVSEPVTVFHELRLPYWYIRYVLAKLPSVEDSGNWEALLPGNFSSEILHAHS